MTTHKYKGWTITKRHRRGYGGGKLVDYVAQRDSDGERAIRRTLTDAKWAIDIFGEPEDARSTQLTALVAELGDDAIKHAERMVAADLTLSEKDMWQAAAAKFGSLVLRLLAFRDDDAEAAVGRAMFDFRRTLDARWDRHR